MAAESSALVLRGAARRNAVTPYGPMVAALRSYLRVEPRGLDGCGPLRPHLALLLPELGVQAPATDRATIFEALRCAVASAAAERPVLLVLDDLHWSDEISIELLAALAPTVTEMPVTVLALYRSDGLPRDNVLRWLRNELRRGGNLEEVVLAPLDRDATGRVLSDLLPAAPSPALVRAVHDRTQGVPFFVEEMAAALLASDRLAEGPRGLDLSGDDVPVPDTVRDAVLMSAAQLSDDARAAAEAGAVAGQAFDMRLVAQLATEAGVAELVREGWLHDDEAGRAAFRHALSREALYADVPWLRRRALHRHVAELLEAEGGECMEIAAHWVGANDASRARGALVRATEESEAVHAYRDATSAGRQALELWPDDDEPGARIELLERYARCAELAGDASEAVKAWRELSEIRLSQGEPVPFADAQRRLAAVYELRGEREAAFMTRRTAVEAYAAEGRCADAAVERIAMADFRRNGAKYTEAIDLATTAAGEATRAERPDLRARALGLEGVARARLGDFDEGLEIVRSGLALAIEHDFTIVAAELYQRLGMVLYSSADYRRAEQVLDEALGLCRTDGDASTEVACVTCLVYVLRECGEWTRAAELSRDLISTNTAVWVAEGMLGAIHGFQGKLGSAAQDADGVTGDVGAGRPLPHVDRLDRGSGLHRRRRGGARRGRPALPGADGALAGERGPPLLDLGSELGGRLPRAARRPRGRALLRGARCRGSRRRRAARTRLGRWRTRSARRRSWRTTPRPPQGSCRAPSTSTAASTSRSRRPSSSCARASRSPRPASASWASSASATPTAPRASSVRGRWRPRPRRRSRSSASRSTRGSEAARRRTPTARALDPPRTRGPAPRRGRAHEPRGRRRSCSSARGRSTCTSATSCASSTAARAWRRPTARESWACWRRAAQPPSTRAFSSSGRELTSIPRTAPSTGPRIIIPSTRPGSLSSV